MQHAEPFPYPIGGQQRGVGGGAFTVALKPLFRGYHFCTQLMKFAGDDDCLSAHSHAVKYLKGISYILERIFRLVLHDYPIGGDALFHK